MQQWNTNICNSAKCLNYRIYKSTFEFEKYLKILPPSLASIMSKFRCLSHKMPIEQGRFFGIIRDNRLCNICNRQELGDEFHYLFNCPYFSQERKRYISKDCYTSPNTYKFDAIMNSTEKQTLVKLALFMKVIISKFK